MCIRDRARIARLRSLRILQLNPRLEPRRPRKMRLLAMPERAALLLRRPRNRLRHAESTFRLWVGLILSCCGMALTSKVLFFLFLALSLSGWLSPPLALSAGILFGLSFPHPYGAQSPSVARFLLQASVVGLGFGMNLHEVLKAGRSGFFYTAVSYTHLDVYKRQRMC